MNISRYMIDDFGTCFGRVTLSISRRSSTSNVYFAHENQTRSLEIYPQSSQPSEFAVQEPVVETSSSEQLERERPDTPMKTSPRRSWRTNVDVKW